MHLTEIDEDFLQWAALILISVCLTATTWISLAAFRWAKRVGELENELKTVRSQHIDTLNQLLRKLEPGNAKSQG